MKKIFLILALSLSGILYGQDTICLTDREYNDLLVKTNCTEIRIADSVLLWDKQHEISLQGEYINGQKQQIDLTEKQLKKTRRQVIKWRIVSIGVGVVSVISNAYLILNHGI